MLYINIIHNTSDIFKERGFQFIIPTPPANFFISFMYYFSNISILTILINTIFLFKIFFFWFHANGYLANTDKGYPNYFISINIQISIFEIFFASSHRMFYKNYHQIIII